MFNYSIRFDSFHAKCNTDGMKNNYIKKSVWFMLHQKCNIYFTGSVILMVCKHISYIYIISRYGRVKFKLY